jgi:hypothetical protein
MRGNREINRPMEGEHAMAQHNTPEHGRPEDGDGQAPKALWAHSLAAAAVCVAIGAAIVLVAIFGQPG